MVKLSPAVTGFAVKVPENPNVPADDADHTVKWVYCSVVFTAVHARSTAVTTPPADTVPHDETCLRVVFPATAVVPAAPGEAVWSCTQV
jgi:hypothetical protein